MIKLYIVIKKINAKLSSKTYVYIDFELLTFCQLIKKTLYIVKSKNSISINETTIYMRSIRMDEVFFCHKWANFIVI